MTEVKNIKLDGIALNIKITIMQLIFLYLNSFYILYQLHIRDYDFLYHSLALINVVILCIMSALWYVDVYRNNKKCVMIFLREKSKDIITFNLNKLKKTVLKFRSMFTVWLGVTIGVIIFLY